jgi:hypothetical protein
MGLLQRLEGKGRKQQMIILYFSPRASLMVGNDSCSTGGVEKDLGGGGGSCKSLRRKPYPSHFKGQVKVLITASTEFLRTGDISGGDKENEYT